MQHSVESKLQSVPKYMAIIKGKATLKSNAIYSSFELIAHSEQQKQNKADTAAAKQKAKEDKEMERAAKCAAQSCCVDDCDAFTCKEGGARGWTVCKKCQKMFCKRHKDKFIDHVISCHLEDKNIVVANVADV